MRSERVEDVVLRYLLGEKRVQVQIRGEQVHVEARCLPCGKVLVKQGTGAAFIPIATGCEDV